MAISGISRGAALSLAASGPLLLAGAAIHPHAPDARNMAEVFYIQTAPLAWWPAHVLLLASYVLFAAFLVGVSRVGEIPSPAERALRVTLPLAWVCVFAMVVHLLLPLGRDSVANSHEGWAFWVKDVAESADAVWAVCVAATAWSLSRAGVAGGRLMGLLGAVGGVGFGVFSIAIPLTGVVLPMQFVKTLVPVLPVVATLLVTAWAVGTGIVLISGHKLSVSPAASDSSP